MRRAIGPTTVAQAALVILVTVFLVLNAVIIARTPSVYWWDAHVRLASDDRILLDRWLPLLQAWLYVLARLDASLAVTRASLALLAALAVVAVYACAGHWAGRAVGLVAAAWLATNRMFLMLAAVPYQEALFLACAFGGLALWARPGPITRAAAVVLIALACLTRYEGWLLPPILIGESVWQAARGGRLRRDARPLALTSAALLAVPLVWWLVSGVALPGGQVAGAPGTLPEYATGFRRMATWPVVALGLLGLVVAWRERPDGYTRWGTALLALAIPLANLAAGLFSPGNLRRPFLGVAFLLPFAALGLVWAVRRAVAVRPDVPLWRGVAVAGGMALLVIVAVPSVRDGLAWPAAAAAEFRAGYVAGMALAGQPACAAAAVLDEDPGFRYVVAVYAGRAPETLLPAASVADLAAAPRPLCVVDRRGHLEGGAPQPPYLRLLAE